MSEIPPELIKTLNTLSHDKPISKENKIFIRDNLDFLQQFADDNELKIINPLFESFKKERFTDNDKSVIIQNRKPLIRIINRYEEEFNVESNEDEIDIEKTVDEVEQELDAKVNKYCGFDEEHPMQGISYVETKKKWRIQTKTCTTSTNNLDLAVQKILDSSNFEKIEKNRVKKSFPYQNHYFMTYWYDKNPLFDIQHIISVLNLKTTSHAEKYNDFSKQIVKRVWHQNDFGGYILRELIPRSTVFEIMLSSNSVISKSFKKDVSGILDELSKDDDLIITNNAVTVRKLKKHANIDTDIDSQIKDMIIIPTPLSYDNPQDMMHLYILINQISFIQLGSYLMQSVLYAFVVSLKRDHRNVVVKFGWSDDILSRIETLRTELCSNVYLIGIKRIKNEAIEKKFHKTLDIKFPTLHEPATIKNKEKKELYKFNAFMMSEFNAVEEDLSTPIQEIILTDHQKTILRSIQNQHVIFQNLVMSQLNFSNILANITDSRILNSCAIMHYQFMALQSNNVQADSNNKHNEKMKQMDYDYKLRLHEADIEKEIKMHETNICKEVKMRELEVKLKEIELENRKLDI